MLVLAVSSLLLVAPVASDTIIVSKATLDRALANPRACLPPEGPGLWGTPLMLGQTGRAAVLSGGRVALMDLEAKVMRLFAPDGREIAKLGSHGQGPGEFGPFAQIFRWPGDTIAVHDFRTARLSLFTEKGFATAEGLGAITGLATGGMMGRLDEGGLVFGTGLEIDKQPEQEAMFRGRMGLVRWNRGDQKTRPLRSDLVGPEWFTAKFGKETGIVAANFGRTTTIGVTGNVIVVYDNATPTVQLLEPDGKTARVIRLALEEPRVSKLDRDTLIESIRDRSRNRTYPARVEELLTRFPETRPAAIWRGTDSEGFWLSFQPPVSAAGTVYLRFGPNGAPNRCIRTPVDARVIALGGDRAVYGIEGEDGDSFSAHPTVPFPDR